MTTATLEPSPPAADVRTPPEPRRPLRMAASLALVAGLLGFVAFLGYWVITGGRWYIVQTPSMGTSAPVGTLLWVEPTDFADLHVGDLITFHPPNSSATYSHRVYAINVDGTISTKGQITAPDPWHLTASNVVGKVSMRWWGMGWLVRAAPYLIIGGLVLWLVLRRYTPRKWRLPGAVVGAALLLSLCIVILRPLTRADQLAINPDGRGVQATYVSTGLLPLRLEATGGAHVDLRDGQVGVVRSTHADARGRYPITLRPHIPWWWWIVLVLACFVPGLWTVVVGVRAKDSGRHRRVDEPEPAPVVPAVTPPA